MSKRRFRVLSANPVLVTPSLRPRHPALIATARAASGNAAETWRARRSRVFGQRWLSPRLVVFSAVATAAGVYAALLMFEKTIRQHESSQPVANAASASSGADGAASRMRTVRTIDGVVSRPLESAAVSRVHGGAETSIATASAFFGRTPTSEPGPVLERSRELTRISTLPIQPVALAPLPPPAADAAASSSPSDARR